MLKRKEKAESRKGRQYEKKASHHERKGTKVKVKKLRETGENRKEKQDSDEDTLKAD